MSQEERRADVVKAALPLVIEYGHAVTIKQIATAAGIAEGTIFRAFDDKEAVIDACIVEAMRPDQVLADVGGIALDQPLAARLVEAAEAVEAHMGRIGSVMRALHHSGQRRRDRSRGSGGRQESMAAIHVAVAGLFEPDRDSLRLPPERLAEVFLRTAFVDRRRSRMKEPTQLSIEELVDLFLNGAITPAHRGSR